MKYIRSLFNSYYYTTFHHSEGRDTLRPDTLEIKTGSGLLEETRSGPRRAKGPLDAEGEKQIVGEPLRRLETGGECGGGVGHASISLVEISSLKLTLRFLDDDSTVSFFAFADTADFSCFTEEVTTASFL